MRRLKYQIDADNIHFHDYPYECSYAYKAKTIRPSNILEMVDYFGMPAICINGNELVFMSAVDRKALLRFCKANAIPINKRIDVWSIILDEFLDTQHTQEWIQTSMAQLNSCGISEAECQALRHEVAERMFAYNFWQLYTNLHQTP